MRLQDKVAFISGSTRGIGRTTAEMFAAEAPRSWCRAARSTRGEGRVADPGAGWRRHVHPSRRERRVERGDAIAATIERYGTLTTLINNAAPTDSSARA